MQIKISIAHKPAREGLFGVIKLDYDQRWYNDDGTYVESLSRPTRNGAAMSVRGLPATARFPYVGGAETVILYEPLERWMYSLCGGNDLVSWRSLLSGGSPESGKSARFFSDFAGTETNRSFILGTNPDAEPIKVKPMGCGGTMIKIIGEMNIGHEEGWVFEAVNPFEDFTKINMVEKFWLSFHPTNSVRIAITDVRGYFVNWLEYISEPFHQFDGRALLPILAQNGRENYIQKSRVRLLSPTELIPSPYLNSVVSGFETPFYPNPYA